MSSFESKIIYALMTLVITFFPLALISRALKTGKVKNSFVDCDKESDPNCFWLTLLVYVIVSITGLLLTYIIISG